MCPIVFQEKKGFFEKIKRAHLVLQITGSYVFMGMEKYINLLYILRRRF
jgi:hypothetical protein